MPRIKYIEKKFYKDAPARIDMINNIISEYKELGFSLTLRQLYYQLVARGQIENSDKSYKNIGSLINDARLAGLINWNAITDRTRNLRENSHWSSPSSVIKSANYSYKLDRWKYQPVYVEVWVEKDALIEIVENTCSRLDVPCFSCRGYTSQTGMWEAAQRFISNDYRNKRVILHLGDHDPSGIDMSRDIRDRLELFKANTEVKRIALTMEQIEELDPPPAPTKITDSRCQSYIQHYGHSSWELDALDPTYIEDLINNNVKTYIDWNLWNQVEQKESKDKQVLDCICDHYNEVESFVRKLQDKL